MKKPGAPKGNQNRKVKNPRVHRLPAVRLTEQEMQEFRAILDGAKPAERIRELIRSRYQQTK
ncbi:hypothetical protein [Deinococcus misasensis]|uniref:hypothetical protein n=1 Tax=Deinococcus misasensis TaxID=392413 RepID=UPI000556340F|nr:hypothetical protein [Deinococcus misasensis]